MHSSGLGVIADKGNDMSFLKSDIPAGQFVTLPAVDKAMDGYKDVQYFMGHARYATKGAINQDNAHPFLHGEVLLAQNGNIRNTKEISPLREFEVDSETAAYFLGELGDTEEFLRRVDGDFCFTWYDRREKRVKIVRNAARPLFMAEARHYNTWYYASELAALEWVLKRNHVIYDLVPVDTGHLYSIDVSGTSFSLDRQQVSLRANHPVYRGGYWSYGDDDEDIPGWDDVRARGAHHYNNQTVHRHVTHPVASVPSTPAPANTPIFLSGRDYDKGKRMLDKLKINKGYTVRFYATHFEKYQSNNTERFGLMKGLFIDPGSLRDVVIHCHAVPPSVFVSQGGEFKRDYYHGPIHNCYWDTKENHYVLIVGTPMLTTKEMMDRVSELFPTTPTMAKPIEPQIVEQSDVTHFVLADNEYVPVTAFLRMTKDGCAHCSCSLLPDDAPSIKWFDKDTPLCEDCAPQYIASGTMGRA